MGSKRISEAAAALGKLGGEAGRGESKRRGDSDHYRALVARRKDRIAKTGRCEMGCTLWRCGREKDHAGPCAP